MSRLSLAVLLLTFVVGCPSSATTPPPPPTPTTPAPTEPVNPPPVVEGNVTVAYENGLRIIVKHIPTAELASMQLYVLGGARFRNEKNAGVEALALRTAVTGGAGSLDKDAFAKKLSRMGSAIGASSYHGYSVVSAKSLTEEFAETFGMLESAFLKPAMPATEVELHRERMLVGIKRRDVTADGQLHLLMTKTVYAGHPFEHLADGNLQSIGSATPTAVAKHLDGLRQTSRLQLVVVGNVQADAVRALVRDGLAKLPRGAYERAPIALPSFDSPTVSVTPDELPTNYVEASFIGPRWGDPLFPASILAMRVLHARVFEEVRTKRNLSYAPSGRYSWSGEVSRGSLYVTAVKANEAMRVMFDQVKRLRSQPVPNKVLAGAKSVFITGHLMGNESTSGQASWLAICDIIGGDFRLARTLPERIRAVSAADVQAFATTYIRHLQTVVIGNPSVIDEKLLKSL